jgi:hypothetical protein
LTVSRTSTFPRVAFEAAHRQAVGEIGRVLDGLATD